MTLCDLDVFERNAGTVAAAVLRAAADSGALDEMLAVVHSDSRLVFRLSTYVLWLDAGQVPSSRYDWHVDRVGGIQGTGADERYDVTDYTHRQSFAVISAFVPDRPDVTQHDIDCVSTEFLARPGAGAITLPNRWLPTSEVDARIRALMAPGFESVHCGDRTAVSFTARTVHRPGRAAVPGRRFFMRIGAYLQDPPTSPYENHITAYNPFCEPGVPGFRLHAVGMKAHTTAKRCWSLPAGETDAIAELRVQRGMQAEPRAATATVAAIRRYACHAR